MAHRRFGDDRRLPARLWREPQHTRAAPRVARSATPGSISMSTLATIEGELNHRAVGCGPSERLRLARDLIPGLHVFTTSFGREDQAIAHVIFTAGLDINVVTLDTGRLFPET